jgi:choline dehydrogenase-like flavoprotein
MKLTFVPLLFSIIGASGASFESPDYVIVGGGPAGFVLADQLTRDGSKYVVLLEAGPDGINSSLINSKTMLEIVRAECSP